MTTPTPNAPLWRRLAAMIYDGFLLFGLLMLYGYVVVFLEKLLLGDGVIESSPTAGGNWLVFTGMLMLISSFYCVFWLKNGQTLGMQAWRLQLETTDGKGVTLRQCITRMLVGTISIATMGAGYWWCLLPEHRTWHDIASRTRVTVHEKRG